MGTEGTAAAASVDKSIKNNNDSNKQNPEIIDVMSDDEGLEEIRKPLWPQSLPHENAKLVFSIVCGNSRYHWGLHECTSRKFTPILFWNSAPARPKETKQEGFLSNHVPEVFFRKIGCPHLNRSSDAQRVLKDLSKLRIPIFHVYLIGTNPDHVNAIPQLFEGLPCVFYNLQATDFLPKETLYPTVGVDRCANMLAACFLENKDENKPILVIDGGTALTWTSANAKGEFEGGGISPGMGIKFESMHRCTGALPNLEHGYVKDKVAKIEETKSPLRLCSTNTEDQMIGGVLRELALNVSSIVRQWVARVRATSSEADSKEGEEKNDNDKDDKLRVVVTGGDGWIIEKLLQPHFSYILEDDAEHTDFFKSGAVSITKTSRLGNHGIGLCLRNKAKALDEAGELSELEKQRNSILGLRVVHPELKRQRARGTVYFIEKTSLLTNDKFKVQYDDGTRAVLSVEELYEGLKTFGAMGEHSAYPDLQSESRLTHLGDAKAAVEMLIRSVPSLESKLKARQEAEARKKRSLESMNQAISKKSKTNSDSGGKGAFGPLSVKNIEANPSAYLKRRVAKFFDDDLFFGTVVRYNGFWRVEYDDGDSEEFDAKDLLTYLKEYDLNSTEDTKR